ncbi:MAG: ATP-binding protein [Trichodesmium sp. MAG_R01]|nr:ATP-binding protein [Trichodesmium sp. MAG_R01]
MHNNDNLVRNPYVFGRPIHEKKQLFGRYKDVQRIKDNITKNDIKISLLHVQRRIGKTSLITCLPQFFTEEENGVKFVPFSFQGYKDKPIPEILNYLADEIAGTIQLTKEVRDKANNTHNFFELFLPTVIDQLSGQKLVLLLDEFDVLEEKGNKGKKLFDNLKKAVNEQKKLFAILVFGRPLKDMKYLERFLQEERQETIEVGLLNDEGTKDLIVKPLERIQSVFRYEPSAIHRIWELSAGHPSLTQLLCSNVFVHCRNKQQSVVRKDDVDSILSQAMEEGQAILQGFLEPLSNIEELFFFAVAEAQEKGTDPLKILKITQRTTITPADLMPAEKRLIELGFVEKNGKRLKIKVELVRLWLIEKNPLPNNKQRKPKEGRKKIKRHRTSSQPNRPNPVAQFIAFIALISVIVFIGQKLLSRIHSSKNYERFQSDCYRLSEEISNALEEKKDTTQLQVIKKVRTEWSREKKGLLDKQCPYSYELDAKYNALLQYYGQSKVDTGNFDEGIEAFCEITTEYKNFSDVKNIFERWVLRDKILSNESTKRVLKQIIKQNQSGNNCLVYSFKDDRKKNDLYDLKAQVHADDYEYGEAVESYCKITENYYKFETVVKQLKKLKRENVEKVEEKLKELNDPCPAFPPSPDN